ncbi:MAG TPA: hypothetical protein ENH62_02420 [Marinobacter sp.]|uniref:Uncharacterized protein n=1 Tax=marine sediment metagenome TaxID=412755 RepID=A0A0F9KW71_9ZZZZ|nr:hypothetical protein [Marinobacter sp.]
MSEHTEIENDLNAYWKAMGHYDWQHTLAVCSRIEKKYGLYGASPEAVTKALNDMMGETDA